MTPAQRKRIDGERDRLRGDLSRARAALDSLEGNLDDGIEAGVLESARAAHSATSDAVAHAAVLLALAKVLE